ncbi:nucleoside 2-deoxyribosyltransferase [Halomicrococcus sp. NG-SE-24]|uniref:nucleoside 2-deoxyribosyltransferase n=1 Tax=Halomicrococcus sp. NG-SE-24 TaxID=3436928 RepID=UPI003D98C63E
MSKSVYFAAPLFTEAELEFNKRVCGMLEAEGHDVFLPQRDGLESNVLVEDKSEEEAMQEIFELDRQNVLDADIVTATLDGRVPSEGVCVEMAFAYDHDIPVIALKTDRRTFGRQEEYNAMLHGLFQQRVDTPEALVEAVNKHDAGQSGQ